MTKIGVSLFMYQRISVGIGVSWLVLVGVYLLALVFYRLNNLCLLACIGVSLFLYQCISVGTRVSWLVLVGVFLLGLVSWLALGCLHSFHRVHIGVGVPCITCVSVSKSVNADEFQDTVETPSIAKHKYYAPIEIIFIDFHRNWLIFYFTTFLFFIFVDKFINKLMNSSLQIK